MASLRARNNILGIVEGTNLEEAMSFVRETYEIARRYGHTTWIL